MLILASGSPRRRELLTQIGVAYMVNPSTYHEESPKKKDPQKYVQAQALGKARDVADKYPGQWVLGADTIVAVDGEILGKPKNEKAAAAMLHELSGKKHSVYTGIALIKDKKEYTKVVETKVWFRRLSEKEIKAYVA
ncbi:nucleoside triphosphate pyrophosphatase, partial [uncultured Megasphaera sp.]